MSSMPRMVCTAESANSSWPVASVNVSGSNTYCHSCMPCSRPRSTMSLAVSNFSAAVLAMPPGPMHMATAGTPYLAITGARPEKRLPSPSRFIEFMTGLPGICRMAASTTAGSVESITSGVSISRLSLLTSATMVSSSSSRSVVATQTSRQWAPASACSRASPTSPS